MKIHPYLLARCFAIKAAFEQQAFKSPAIAAAPVTPAPIPKGVSWEDLLKDSGDDTSGGGGGTMQGLRGKKHLEALRRMGRR